MKTFISRWLLLAAGILCLNFNTPAVAQVGDKERIETIQKALKTATEKSKSDTIWGADYTEGLRLIQLAIKPAKTDCDKKEKNLIFDYAGKSFVLMNDEEGYVVLKVKIIVFDPKAKK